MKNEEIDQFQTMDPNGKTTLSRRASFEENVNSTRSLNNT